MPGFVNRLLTDALGDLNDVTLTDENIVADFENDAEEYVGDNLVTGASLIKLSMVN